jgi:hypothetical protein
LICGHGVNVLGEPLTQAQEDGANVSLPVEVLVLEEIV